MSNLLKRRESISKILFQWFFLFLLSGCAWTPQVANLNPAAPKEGAMFASGQTLGLKVLDERPTKLLGYRGHARGAGAEITTGQNVAEIMYEKILEGLENSGFKVETYKEGMSIFLKLEIRQIEYHSSQGLVTYNLNSSSAIKGYCKNGKKSYEQMYRGESEEEWLVPPFAGTNERIINESLSEVLKKIFIDKNLLECLAQ